MRIITYEVLRVTRDILDRMKRRPQGRHRIHPDYPTTYDINDGLCEDLAGEVVYSLKEELPGIRAVWLDEIGYDEVSHCVVEYQGWYYDSECPQGTDDPRLIPCWANRNRKREDVLAERKSSILTPIGARS